MNAFRFVTARRLVIAVSAPLLLNQACQTESGGEDTAQTATTAAQLEAPATPYMSETEYISGAGKRYVRVTDDFLDRVRADKGFGDYSDQEPDVAAAMSNHAAMNIAYRPAHELSDTELAEALRPLAIVAGRVYLAAEVDVEAVKKMRGLGEGDHKLAEGFSPDGSYDVFFPKQAYPAGCCGSDGRWAVGNNTAWPYATVIATMVPVNSGSSNWGTNIYSRECTWQLIGRSTATAVAHCFIDTATNAWLPLVRWGAAPDAADNLNQPIPSGYPTAYYGYTRHVPLAYIDATAHTVVYDFAVLDFTGWPIPNPGNTAGWMGWGVASSSTILASYYQIWGVPKVDFQGSWKNPYPRIWGSLAAQLPSAIVGVEIRGPGDISGGNSGSGFWQQIDAWGGLYMTGMMSGFWSSPAVAYARRLDSTVASFIQTSASEY